MPSFRIAGDPLFTLTRAGKTQVQLTNGVRAELSLDETSALTAVRSFCGGGGTMAGVPEEKILSVLSRWYSEPEARSLLSGLAEKGLIVEASKTSAASNAPLFMIFCPRSGSNMLRWLVDTHPNISCPPPSVALHVLVDAMNHVHSGAAFRGLRSPREWTRALMRDFIARQMDAVAKKNGKSRWCHRIWTTYAVLPYVDDLFAGNAKYLFLVRHALDVVDAASKVYVPAETWQMGPNGVRVDYFKEHGGSYPIAYARLWAEISQRMLEFKALHPDRVHVLRYEDLVTSPAERLEALFKFCGESMPQGLVEKAFEKPPQMLPGWQGHEVTRTKKVESDHVGQWRAWDQNVVRAVAPFVNDQLSAWGYDRL